MSNISVSYPGPPPLPPFLKDELASMSSGSLGSLTGEVSDLGIAMGGNFFIDDYSSNLDSIPTELDSSQLNFSVDFNSSPIRDNTIYSIGGTNASSCPSSPFRVAVNRDNYESNTALDPVPAITSALGSVSLSSLSSRRSIQPVHHYSSKHDPHRKSVLDFEHRANLLSSHSYSKQQCERYRLTFGQNRWYDPQTNIVDHTGFALHLQSITQKEVSARSAPENLEGSPAKRLKRSTSVTGSASNRHPRIDGHRRLLPADSSPKKQSVQNAGRSSNFHVALSPKFVRPTSAISTSAKPPSKLPSKLNHKPSTILRIQQLFGKGK